LATLKKLAVIYLLLFTFQAICQELPPIVNYSAGVYSAGNQNWMMSQDGNSYMYFANNEGLLEYNGATWTLYPTPNETIMRSVKVLGDKVYTGFYMDFGYWKRQDTGILKYYSLTKKIRNKIIDDEQFWNIAQYDHWILFQSLSQIFIYDCDTDTFNIIGSNAGINKVFTVENRILYQTLTSGLYEIENGKGHLISDAPFFKNNKVVNIFGYNAGMIIQTQYNGFYEFREGVINKWVTEADTALQNSSAYSGQMLSDGSIAVGTVSNGVFIISRNKKLKYHITQSKGLSNNTALSLFEDRDRNLWIGLDNGINCINMQSAIHNFVDNSGQLGTVYASTLFEGRLYIGTNQGLFYKPYPSDAEFRFISGTKGQVWSLYQYGGTLFCGHDYGTYIIKDGSAKQIYSGIGTWKFEPHPTNKSLLLQGNYMGLSVLEKTALGWKFRNRIIGFDNSSRYFAIDGSSDIYISHEYKGIYRISVDSNYTMATKVSQYKYPGKGRNASLTKFGNSIYYAYKEGVFKLNKDKKQFNKNKSLSKIFLKDEYTSGNLIGDYSSKLWFFSKNYINYYSLGKLNADLKHNVIAIPSSLTNSMPGFENITQFSTDTYLIGTTDGYYTLNIKDVHTKSYSVYISNVTASKMNGKAAKCEINKYGSFDDDLNNVTFSFTVPEYSKYINTEYQFILDGIQNNWSSWNERPTANFKNLPSGEYTFRVKARTGSAISSNIATYRFTILKPWYGTATALMIYFILGIISALLINRTYKNYYNRQKEKLIQENNRLLEIKELETEQEMMRFKNTQLQKEFENKNRELASSTMNLIKKNELLSAIKDDLKKTSEGDRSFKSVITTINKNINEDDTWDMFKEAFNNADKDFLKKVKKMHPLLTPNDLRLCAYLRLNLSSKEIAPLLNISVRSVEIKRYRLRKKMDLKHELSLVEYILSI
jgi:AraC family chitin signaling transcriptional activator